MKALPKYLHDRQSILAQLSNQLLSLNQLSALVQEHVPEAMASACQVVRHDLRQDVLVISVDEQVFLTQARFLQPHLLQQLRRQSPFKQLRQIDFVYTPKVPGPNQPDSDTPTLSAEAKSACLNAAELCTHPALQAALQRLAAMGSGQN